MIMAIIIMVVIIITLPEVPSLDVVVETDAIGAAELGQDFQNLVLLFWRDHVFTMMDSVVGTIATTKGGTYTQTGLSFIPLWNIII